MKSILRILLPAGLAVLLVGCSGLPAIRLPQFIPTPTAPPPTETPTPLASRTPIPTQNLFATSTSTLLTFTPTVTMIGAELFTPTQTPTAFPTLVPFTPGLPPGASNENYFTPDSAGFLSILTSSSVIYWNEGPCAPREIKFSAFVADQVNTDKVLLFMRLREKQNTLLLTDWGAGAIMTKAENGSFNYDVRTFNLNQYYYFREAWLEYQLVALSKNREVIGRTPVHDHDLSLIMCRPVQ
jgi:hypothetical protein